MAVEIRLFSVFAVAILVAGEIREIDPDLKELDDKLLLTLLNPSVTASGDTLLEGDIAVPAGEDDGSDDNGLIGRKGLPNKGGIWPDRQIPYEFHQSVNDHTKKVIEDALKEWERKTCVKFSPKNNEKSYLRFRTDSAGCWTYVGRMYTNGQDVNIGEGCEHVHIVMHEVGHSLGFFHEQSRRDRTSELKILWPNIQQGMTSQFQTGNDSPRGVPYDVTSVMHYSPMAFSNRMFEKNTMVSVNPHLQRLVGENRGITFRDSKLANLMYSCDDKCPNRANPKCQNEGYLAPYRGGSSPCPCVCPPHTKGEFCETVIGDYYGTPDCGGDVTDERVIETPTYPSRSKIGGSCSWKITAPPGKKVSVEFLDFNFRPRFNRPTSPFNGRCVFEYIEIRSRNQEDGDMYCGTDIAPGTKMVSSANTMLILIKADGSAEGKGLRAKITHI